ncbi:MAG: tRNA lysidine(34) synthetase TilS [Coriobacteriales bacterium]
MDTAPLILMVSGGSDSTALLELAARAAAGIAPSGPLEERLRAMLLGCLPSHARLQLLCLHVNHQLRGEDSEQDQAFVEQRCRSLGVPFESRRVDVAARVGEGAAGMEAAARELRYQAAALELERWCAQCAVPAEEGLVLTAHTLDDRVETFLMRAMVGTGPGGLGSIPRRRGCIVRPLLDATRQELRDLLCELHPGSGPEQLWREDATNQDGSNFRSKVRMRLVPVMEELKPGFQRSLARTMDLIAQEDDALSSAAAALVYRNLIWEGDAARLPLSALRGLDEPMTRRVIRQCLLVVKPEARLESRQIQRVLDGIKRGGAFATELDGALRAEGCEGELRISVR